MLRAKNILIIFILNYLLILLVCCFLEIIFISNHAQAAQLLMRTAADMALEQVQATDDFFVTGGGYLLEDQQSYKLYVSTGSRFEQVELFPAFTGETEVGDMYAELFGDGRMTKFINDSITNGSNVLSPSFVAGYTQPPYTYTMPVNVDKDGDGTIDGSVDVQVDSNVLKTNWYYVPKLFQMGNTILNLADSDIDFYFKTLNAAYTQTGIEGQYSGSKRADIQAIQEMYELIKTEKLAYKEGQTDPIKYYFTPISLGVTYINEDLLQALFINNIDLLMRSKYMQNPNYNLGSEEFGNGVLKGAFYSELTDVDSLSHWNPINNGAFSFLRGEEVSGTAQGAKLYEGTVKPKIEYIVLDMYNNSEVNNEVLRQILGPRFTKDTQNGTYFSDSTAAGTYAGRKIEGRLLEQIDQSSVDFLETTIFGAPQGSSLLQHKPIVVAKVTFYADFIIPYSTVSLREMRGREENNNIGGRLLFDAFSTSSTNGLSYLDDNYVDLEIRSSVVAIGESGWDKIYPDEYYDDIGVNVNRLDGNYHSDAMTYTTYFAITP